MRFEYHKYGRILNVVNTGIVEVLKLFVRISRWRSDHGAISMGDIPCKNLHCEQAIALCISETNAEK